MDVKSNQRQASFSQPIDRNAEIAVKLMALRRPIDPVFAPDGKRLAFVVSQICKTADGPPQSEVWISDLGNSQVVSEAGWTHSLPRWSPNGNTLAFVSDRGNRGVPSHIFLLDQNRFTPIQVADVGGTIEELIWESDHTLLLLIADVGAENISMYGAARPPSQADPQVTQPGGFWRRIKRLDIQSGQAVEVGPVGWNIWEFSTAGSNRVVAIGSQEPTENGWYRSSVLDIDLVSRQARVIHATEWLVASPVMSPDLTRVAFVEGWASDRGLLMGEVRLIDLKKNTVSAPLPIPADVSWLKWRDPANLYFAGIRGLETAYGWIDVDSNQVRVWAEKATLRSRSLCEVTPSPDGSRVAAVMDRFEAPWELAWREFSEETPHWHFITHLNDWWRQNPPPWTCRRITWTGRDGLELEGFLVEQPGGGARPMLVNARGGPTFPYRWGTLSMIASAAAEAGYNVLLPVPRGTPGRGQAFTRANVGDPGGEELYDILRGMDACVEMGVAIRDRIAIGGGSYSGYLTAWAVTQHSERFACAIMMYGISNNVSCHRTCNNARFYEFILQARPVGRDGVGWYMERSPITYIENCQTPTLVMHGERDLCTPLGQGIEFYQGLVDQGIPTELVVYPREGHAMGNWEREHQIDFSHRVQAWLNRYLGNPNR
ncbi:MAG TPA: S9 family peptidase [Anaerolineae bacterium]|nr:S9 family peptidase [Anaerolineae bacterium]